MSTAAAKSGAAGVSGGETLLLHAASSSDNARQRLDPGRMEDVCLEQRCHVATRKHMVEGSQDV